MAIQDDNTVLCKGDLKAYHEKILPYLGGNMALSTNVSDYYSTDEKIVGVWLDGKPLYQKTIHVTSATIPAWTRYTISTTSLLDNDNIFIVGLFGGYYADFDGSAKQYHFWGGQDITGNSVNSMYGYNAHYRQKDKVIALNGSWGGLQYTITDLTFHFQYTKITDTPNSAITTPGCYDINFPNTWPENTEVYFGNGLYGRRFVGTAATTTTIKDIDLLSGLPTTTTIVKSGGILKRHVMGTSYYDFTIPFVYESLMSGTIAFDAGVLKFVVKNSGTADVPYDIWVCYTK